MRTTAISLAISIVFSASAWCQTTPPPNRTAAPGTPAAQKPAAQRPAAQKPAAHPIAAAARRSIAVVSKSPLPTFDDGSYQRISAAMLSYAAIEVRGGWPVLPVGAKLAPGALGPDVALLRKRLVASDDLSANKIEGELYDDAVTDAVRRFQARHGLAETGSVGAQTLAAMNVSVGKRIRQLAASLDRLAELNFTFGQRYVVVNIPAAVAEAVEGDKVKHRYVVVVGKVDRPSPSLTTMITAVNFNPTWTVPLSIMKKDIITRMRRDPGYVTRMRMQVLDGNGAAIDPRTVDWKSDRAPNFTIRQDAGAGNALGALRIDMPNPHAVYMHDTNHKEFFSADYRFHSSGCTRVAEVRELATWLLEDTAGWDRKRIDASIATGQSSNARLSRKVPVAWVYFTGWVTRDDVVHFRNDVYHSDEPPPSRAQIAQAARPQVQASARAAGFVTQSIGRPSPEPVSFLDSR